jgi:Glycosyltransferase like family/Methyltransferase domain
VSEEAASGNLDGVVRRCLVRRVPATARTVVQVGAVHGWLAAALKKEVPGRVVHGLDLPAASSAEVREHLDTYTELDLEHEDVALPPGSVDCIVYADTLCRVRYPLAVLARHLPLLAPSGRVVCSVPNVQHQSVVSQLLRGSFPYGDGGSMSGLQVGFFTFASALRLLLDAGYSPNLVDTVELPGGEAFLRAGAPLFELLGVGPRDAEHHAKALWMVLEGRPLPDLDLSAERPLTFVCCVNDEAQLQANLLSSPCLQHPSPHEVLLFRGRATAAEGLNEGLRQAKNELVVFVHQDVYLPKGWPARFSGQWEFARRDGGPIGVAGVFGVKSRRVPFDAIGRVVHSDRLLVHGSLPADVDGLDELLMVVERETALRVDPALGWHLYGTDLSLQAHQHGLRVVVLDAPCHHNSLTGRIPSHYRSSERVLAGKWEGLLPIHTNISSIDAWLLGAPADPTLPETPRGKASEPLPVEAELVERLRTERAALSAELERARVQVASMEASPFWRAREAFAAIRGRLTRRGVGSGSAPR